MIIFGLDPGTARVGWGVIRSVSWGVEALSYGCIETSQKDTRQDRLLIIYQSISKYLKKFKPEAIAIEDIFFATNAKTVIQVGEARGVILLTSALAKLKVISYTPLVVKQTICGTGAADKSQIQKMVTRLLKLPKIPKPDDTADALAIALTHAYSYKLKSKLVQ